MSLYCRLSPNSDLLFIIVPTPQGMRKNKNATYFVEAGFKYRLIISNNHFSRHSQIVDTFVSVSLSDLS